MDGQITGPVSLSVMDGVGVIDIDAPPCNVLTPELRAALLDALAAAEGDPDLRALVLSGGATGFPPGADVREYDAAPRDPSQGALCARLACFPRPVVAALSGAIFGGGIALALAAHHRVAAAEARLSFPEVRLGLVPGGGATQLLPRLLGAGPALDLMLSGRTLRAADPALAPLFDAVTTGEPRAAAIALARRLAAAGAGPRPTATLRPGMGDGVAYQRAIAARRARLSGTTAAAAARIVDAVEAAQILPIEAGLAFEAEAAEESRRSDVSVALRHVFAAEQRAPRLAACGRPPAADIGSLAILGGGLLAAHLAIAALDRGLAVRWGTRRPDILREGMVRVRAHYDRLVSEGLLAEARAAERLDRLALGDSAAMAEGADFVIHAARGQGDVPVPARIVRAVAFPGWVERIGLRFAAPATRHPLVEVIEGPAASAADVDAALALARALGKVAVRVVSDGLSASGRLTAALHRAADGLVDAGQAPADVDAALRAWGWARPSFELRDVTGLDGVPAGTRPEGAVNWSALLSGAGRHGRADGTGGFYDWTGATPVPAPAAQALIDAARPPAPPLPPEAISGLMLAALANEGARMLEEGMVTEALEIDAAAVLGCDFPRHRGGPMKAADLAGLFGLRRALDGFDHPDRAFWAPHPLWAMHVREGTRFCDPA
ncbi:enoyl-CoA hydratase/isomerase family protein [Roseivivax isoporae]|uniref:3-hydroxyacyl-CoA dehydrogenase NAD binding domain-containing protein n=1 Tax=Roseivivax isoporae LMG 25204 TaxID=1449351 RepID=X7F189_9RHOB|nr:enoyl-CoA hydratase/isomerase family protein [Roseivivax isoporae]ETX26677.1 hypothetical protein RISW2_20735 [Roseivivax isoporae LMG 25204]